MLAGMSGGLVGLGRVRLLTVLPNVSCCGVYRACDKEAPAMVGSMLSLPTDLADHGIATFPGPSGL